MSKLFNSKENSGGLMIEALAMLTLIAMVTPILYKKAAERTTELQDINAASQMRVMIQGFDDYIKDHYSEIIKGNEITTGCKGAETQNFDTFKNDGTGAVVIDKIAHLCDYLPYGFVDEDGNIRGSNTFNGYQLAIAKRSSAANNPTQDINALTGFILADPKFEIPMIRASRIASMIGSNGGYTQGKEANGVQGVWKVDDLSTLGLEPQHEGSIVAASFQSITSGSMASDDYLKRVPGDSELENTMETTLSMGGHDIKDVNQLIITGDGDDALKIENGGADIAGDITAGGDITADGNLSASGGKFKVQDGKLTATGAQINGNANVTGSITGGSANISGNVNAGTINTTGNVTVGGALTVNKDGIFKQNINVTGDSTVGGNSTVKGNLQVDGSATINNNLTVGGTSNLNNLNVAGTSNFQGDANFEQNVSVGGDLSVGGTIKSEQTKSKRLQGGLMANDWASNPSNDRFVFTAEWGRGNINNSKVFMGPNNEVIVGNKSVSMNVSGTQIVMAPKDGSVTLAPGGVNSRELIVTKGQTLVDNGRFIVSTGATNGLNQLETSDSRIDMFRDTNGSILSVTNGTASTDGSVQIRKGVLEVSSNYSSDILTSLPSGTGYILADRFVDQRKWDAKATPTVADVSSYHPDYDAYQVNPAYTSVMHDIKLTTRGGARLSDILPDFINKGIYVVSNNYDENVPYWEKITVSVKTSGGKKQVVPNIGSGKQCSSTDSNCWTSPWMGIIPAPICPPGYARIITINPAGWAMAQAGVPGPQVSASQRRDLWTPDYPRNPSDTPTPTPLYFQKNTWLRANVYPHKSGNTFYGWSAIMGFMYPYVYYKDYIDDLGLKPTDSVSQDTNLKDSELVVWNLFPVLRRQLEAYVTVYCYFDRVNDRYSNAYVDKYDQFNNFRSTWSKDNAYAKRLNDPTLSYDDIW